MNKNIPKFFVKKNNHDPIIIQRLPFKYIMEKFDKGHSNQVESRIERATHNIEQETTNAGGALLQGKATIDDNFMKATQHIGQDDFKQMANGQKAAPQQDSDVDDGNEKQRKPTLIPNF